MRNFAPQKGLNGHYLKKKNVQGVLRFIFSHKHTQKQFWFPVFIYFKTDINNLAKICQPKRLAATKGNLFICLFVYSNKKV
ncbi:hypothetical protein B9P78_08995 [Aerococcus sp. 1KP-2016]|nr:hypothetical protein B9P78_08995 [Aerococcus sp. 1KP-2016]